MDQNQNNFEQSTLDKNGQSPHRQGSKRWWAWPIVILLCALGISAYQGYRQDSTPANDGPSIAWLNDYDTAVKLAQQENKTLLIAFSRHGCPACNQMKSNVYNDPGVLQVSQEFVAVYIDTDAAQNRSVVNRFGVEWLPTYVILQGDSQILHSFAGYNGPAEFISQLRSGLREAGEPAESVGP